MTDSRLSLDNPAWRFALAVYAESGVADECLVLQERYGVDVSLLLFCGWLGAGRGVALDAGEFAALRDEVEAWHAQAVKVLRAARQTVKAMPQMRHAEVSDFRDRLKALELDSERLEVAFLAQRSASRWPLRAGDVQAALRNLQRALDAASGRGDLAIETIAPALVRAVSARAPRSHPR